MCLFTLKMDWCCWIAIWLPLLLIAVVAGERVVITELAPLNLTQPLVMQYPEGIISGMEQVVSGEIAPLSI